MLSLSSKEFVYRTSRGRVVYNRKLHPFTARDVVRISRSVAGGDDYKAIILLIELAIVLFWEAFHNKDKRISVPVYNAFAMDAITTMINRLILPILDSAELAWDWLLELLGLAGSPGGTIEKPKPPESSI